MNPELVEAMRAMDAAVDRLLALRKENAQPDEMEKAFREFEEVATPLKQLMAEHQLEYLRKRLSQVKSGA